MLDFLFSGTVQTPTPEQIQKARLASDKLYQGIENYKAGKINKYTLDDIIAEYGCNTEKESYKLGFSQGIKLARECAAIAP